MNITDTHVHSDLSFDSVEYMENYVKKAAADGDEYFITTEHVDLESHVLDGGDIAPDFERQLKIIDEMNAKYPVKTLLGVEIGWRHDLHRRDMEIAHKYPFDMILLSIHETEYADVSYPDYMRGRTVDQCYDEYLDLACRAIKNFDNFDIFAHVDYVLRYIGDTDLCLHREKLEQVFRLLIEKDKALEINTKMFPQPESVRRAEDIIRMYTAVGGRKISLGSDAHSVDRHRNGFDTVIGMLKKYGVDRVCMFVKRKEFFVEI
ncbi:MAG: PHP domain-containing protein [Oscillospiraceae bacterium]|nr:PHP domain-containing protein [Oscillospiraceae bacterium]